MYQKVIFAILLEFSKTQHFTLIIDEFQEFFQINPAVYSDIQKLWDLNKKTSKIHVIFIGSVYSLIRKIFENDKQPLFGRADRIIGLKALSLQTTASVVGIKNFVSLASTIKSDRIGKKIIKMKSTWLRSMTLTKQSRSLKLS